MSTLIYGVLIREEEFFSTQSIGKRCGCGNVKPPDSGPYCTHCGKSYAEQLEHGLTSLCLRFSDHFKIRPKAWRDNHCIGSSILQGTHWFHQRTNEYDRTVDYAIVGREFPFETASSDPTKQWPVSDTLYFFRPASLQQHILDDPEDPDYDDDEGNPADDGMARFLKETRDEIEKLSLLEGRELRVYLW